MSTLIKITAYKCPDCGIIRDFIFSKCPVCCVDIDVEVAHFASDNTGSPKLPLFSKLFGNKPKFAYDRKRVCELQRGNFGPVPETLYTINHEDEMKETVSEFMINSIAEKCDDGTWNVFADGKNKIGRISQCIGEDEFEAKENAWQYIVSLEDKINEDRD